MAYVFTQVIYYKFYSLPKISESNARRQLLYEATGTTTSSFSSPLRAAVGTGTRYCKQGTEKE